MEGVAGREAAGRPLDAPWRRLARDERGGASRVGRGAGPALCEFGRAGAGDRFHRLRSRRTDTPGHRLGEIGGAGAGSNAGKPAALVLTQRSDLVVDAETPDSTSLVCNLYARSLFKWLLRESTDADVLYHRIWRSSRL